MAKYKKYRRSKSFTSSGVFLLVMIIVVIAILIPASYLYQINQLYLILGIITFISILVSIIALWLYSYKQRQKIKALDWAQIDQMSGVEFEQYIGKILISQGYKVEFTKTSGDYGIDILAQKSGKRVGIQTKRYKDPANIDSVYQAVAGMKYYNCSDCWVITSSYFTLAAKNLAEVNNCTLIDRDTLSEWILEFKKQSISIL